MYEMPPQAWSSADAAVWGCGRNLGGEAEMKEGDEAGRGGPLAVLEKD